MKRYISIILVVILLFSASSCTQAVTDIESVDNNLLKIEELQHQLAEKQNLINELTSRITQKEEKIEELTSENSLLENYKDTYGDFIDDVYGKIHFNIGQGGWDDRTENLPEYKEGSIELKPREGFSGRNFHFERKYRLCYYDASLLPLENALRFVRGYEGDKIYNGTLHSTLLNTPEKVYLSDFNGYFGEPIMHYYLWFILAYRVSKSEMEQMVEILSDTDHIIYENWASVKFTDFSFDNERFELPNVDILYTFDADIINEYYRYA